MEARQFTGVSVRKERNERKDCRVCRLLTHNTLFTQLSVSVGGAERMV